MIFKFCFKNEIHRCSEPPSDFPSLLSLLKSTFKAELPKNFSLYYIVPGTEQQVSLTSQESYESLLNTNDSKTVKIFITEAEDRLNSSEYDVISAPQKNEDILEEFKTGDKQSLEKVVQNVTEAAVNQQVQKLPYFSYMPMQDEHLQKMIRDIVQEQIPAIVSKVKELVLQELRPLVANRQEQVIQQDLPKVGEKIIEQEFVVQKEVNPKSIFEDYLQGNFEFSKENQIDADYPIKISKMEERENIFDKIKKIGASIKEKVAEFPENAKNALDDWSHKIEGDPNVQIEEGKYPKSVIEKADSLKEVFIDESRKDLLEFVKKYPRTVNLEQLAHMFMVKDQVQEEEHEEVVEFQQNNNNNNININNEEKEQRLDEH